MLKPFRSWLAETGMESSCLLDEFNQPSFDLLIDAALVRYAASRQPGQDFDSLVDRLHRENVKFPVHYFIDGALTKHEMIQVCCWYHEAVRTGQSFPLANIEEPLIFSSTDVLDAYPRVALCEPLRATL